MKHLRHALPRRQHGVTLVELMVGLVISIVISLAAASLYMVSRETTRATQSQTDINETGKIALDMIGRELQKAGFYPAQFTTPANVAEAGRYYNGKPGSNPLFEYGLSGCEGAKYNPATRTCGTTTAGTPDTVIVNYFSSPEFGATSLIGNTNDCNRQPVSGDADNAARAAAGFPLFVSNRFGLESTSYTLPDGSTVSTRSLACHGNGNEAASAAQQAVQGIEDLVIRYGVSTDGTAQSPTRFHSAASVPGTGTSTDGLAPWQRVTAVHVCIVVRSLDNTRLEDKATSVRTYKNCRGGTTTLPSTNRYIYRSFERVFAIRNNLHAVGTF